MFENGTMTEDEACLCFSLSDGVGPKTFIKLVKFFGSAKDAWEKLDGSNYKEAGLGNAAYKKLESSRADLELAEYLDKLKKTKVKAVGYTDEKYPQSLKELDAPPIVLFCKGNLELLKSSQNIGVVGARKITNYGKEVTEKLTAELVSCDMTIVSGLAFGVDATAHKTTVENQGNTVAVLGCGVDCCTPAENQDLYEKILDNNGLIISEYPLGMPPLPGTFPARNRIIAALSLGILVTEAAEDSGSLITAKEARKLEKPVFAVPGPITAQMSRGSLKLLKEDASLVTSGKDILEVLKIKSPSFVKTTAGKQNLKLSKQEKRIVELLENEEMPLDSISKATKIPMVKLMVLVSGLEMRNVVKIIAGDVILITD